DVLTTFRLPMIPLPAPPAWIQNLHMKSTAGDRDNLSVHNRLVAASADQHRVHSRRHAPDFGCLLFVRFDPEAPGFTLLRKLQPEFAPVQANQHHRSSCSLPWARQREIVGTTGASGFCDFAWTAATSAATASSSASASSGALRARKASMNPV